MINAEIRPLWQQNCLLHPEAPIRSKNFLAEVFVGVVAPAQTAGYAEELQSTMSTASPRLLRLRQGAWGRLL